MEATGKTIECVVVTPEKKVLDETVEFVALPLFDGELGILAGRAPLIGRLGYGELRTRKGDTEHRYYIDGGFAQVRANVVTVLTPRALRAEEIDSAAAERTLEASRQPADSPHAQESHLKDQARARSQLMIARRAKG